MSDKQLNNQRVLSLTILSTFVILLGTGGKVLRAQESGSAQDSLHNQDAAFEGVIIDSIEITSQDVFDTKNVKYNRFPYRLINRLHIQTKPFVIRSEVLLQVGKPYSNEMARETERNIRARLFVYEAEVKPERLANGKLLVRIHTIDQWSIAGGVGLRKEGDALEYDITFEDRNLFGLNHRFAAQQVHPAHDDNYATLLYSTSRIGKLPYSLSFFGTTNTESRGFAAELAHPYFDRLQRFSYGVNGGHRKGAVTIRDDTEEPAKTEYRASSLSLAGFYRSGTLREKLTLGLFYKYQFFRNDSVVVDSGYTLESVAAELPVDTVYHEIGVGAELRRIDYLQLKRIDRYAVVEDFTVGPTFLFLFAKPFAGYQKDEHRYEVGVGYTGYRHHTLVSVNHQRGYLFNETGRLRTTTRLHAKLYNNYLPWMTVAMNSIVNTAVVHSGSNPLILGGFSGLRGYPQYFKTGNRTAVLSSELRFFSGLDIFSIAIGSAFFADVGTNWKHGDHWRELTTYGSVGAGLRFNADRVSGGATFRVDVVYSKLYGTEVSVGLGQNISAKSGEIGLTNH